MRRLRVDEIDILTELCLNDKNNLSGISSVDLCLPLVMRVCTALNRQNDFSS